MVIPIVPPRPGASKHIDIPAIPPRPRRGLDRSVSPGRDSYARSPLNDPAFFPPGGKASGASALSRSFSRDLPARPPSVTLPSVGQEGSEYAHVNESDVGAAEQTKTVSGELPLLAPKASLPASTAKSRIATVTRTDSATAAAAGIGKPSSDIGDPHPHLSQLAHELSRSNSAQQQLSRPSSLYRVETEETEEQGIPEIGMQIPLYPNAGDVQAPTPGPGSNPGTPGLFQPPSEGRNHYRTKSGREVFNGPPGSYGRHGHGVVAHKDPFEKAWYDKHPEARAREAEGEYGPKIPMERKDYHLDSTKLNRLVQEPLNDIPKVGTPDEQIGYLASEEYTQRLSSPRPGSEAKRKSLQYDKSPLRKMSRPQEERPSLPTDGTERDDEVIHVEHPSHLLAPVDRAASRLGDDSDHEQPILAADEVRKRPEGQFMTPAIDLEENRRDLSSSRPNSRPHSRSNSVQISGAPLLPRNGSERENNNTPLEDVKEYEPLFPEDEGFGQRKKAPSFVEEHAPRHYFPSKDVWEDTPESVMYETTVKTPQIPEFSRPEAEHEPREIFETPEDEAARKAKLPSALASSVQIDSTSKSSKTKFNSDITSEMSGRPSLRHRFPSQDVWEDTPDSLMYTTTVGDNPQGADVPQVPAKASKPSVPARPARSTSREKPGDNSAPQEHTFAKVKPPVPARPAGSKISALRGAFMSDLEGRLKQGPQAVPKIEAEPEEEAEKAPLTDARKGRARGPARRKPGASPSGNGEVAKSVPKVSFVSAVTVWEINEDGALDVVPKHTPSAPQSPTSSPSALKSKPAPKLEQEVEPEPEPEASSREETESSVKEVGATV